jgi:hypothetical protein
MKPRPRDARPYKHPSTFLRQLDAYSLAAVAAGVSLLALTAPSEAKIVYTQAHRVISKGEHYSLDFNHDRITDLSIQNIATRYCTTEGSCRPADLLQAAPSGSDAVVYNLYGAVAMKSGMKIGPGRTFKIGPQQMVWSTGNAAVGSWINVKNRYLGVKFSIKGETHYGWARLNVRVSPGAHVTAILTGYAYETIPNKPIVAGKTRGPDVVPMPADNEPVTLGGLALGRK